MNILEFTKYLSNYDIIKYVLLISFIWIFFNLRYKIKYSI